MALGITDSAFIMGSMGSVVGEKLTRAVEARRRRRTAVVAGLAAAAAAVAALSVPMVLDRDDAPPVTGPGTSSPSSDVETRTLAPLGEAPIRATLGLEQVTWGTRMLLTCTYDPGSVDFELPDEVDYLLYVRAKDGRTEQVGSWRSVAGATMRVPAATSVVRGDIATVFALIRDYPAKPPAGQWEWAKDADQAMRYTSGSRTGGRGTGEWGFGEVLLKYPVLLTYPVRSIRGRLPEVGSARTGTRVP